MPIFSIIFVLLLSCSVVTPPNLVVVVEGVTVIHSQLLACDDICLPEGWWNMQIENMYFYNAELTYWLIHADTYGTIQGSNNNNQKYFS
jgi:hypothetical protein